MALQIGGNTPNSTPGNITPAPGTVDPATQALESANFDPSKGPVSSFNANGDLVGPNGQIVLTSAQIHSGTVPDSLLTQIANNPYVKAGVTATTAPLVGGAAATTDIYNGKYSQVPGDLTFGATGGIAGNTNGPAQAPINPQTVGQAIDATGKVINQAGGDIATGAKDLGAALGIGSSGFTLGDADAETARANALADALGSQAGAAGANAAADRGLSLQTRDQQEQSIRQLQDAANGTVPSAAELQLKQQASTDAAREYGLAAAMQGNNPLAALRQASLGAAQVAGTTNQNAAINRANEQATARTALANALQGTQNTDETRTNTDTSQQANLTNAQTTSQGQGVTATGQKLGAEGQQAVANAAKVGALAGAGGTLLGGLISDKRTKKSVAKSELADALGKGVHGVTFAYKPEFGENDAPHFGLLADELEKVIPGVVKRGPIGIKVVDTGHLTTANTAVLAELARRLQELEGKKEARK